MNRYLLVSTLLLLAACEHQGLNAGIHGHQGFDAYGNEPFWHANIIGTTATYTTPENQDGVEIPVTRTDSTGSVSFHGTLEEEPIHFSITNLNCTDSMSGEKFPYSVVREWKNTFESGCAKPAEKKTAQREAAAD